MTIYLLSRVYVYIQLSPNDIKTMRNSEYEREREGGRERERERERGGGGGGKGKHAF